MQPIFIYHSPLFDLPGAPPEQLFACFARNVQAAEDAGFWLATVMDHFYQIRGVGPETWSMLEAYTTLGAAAAVTRRIRLGTMVSGVTYRNPAMLAKQVTTLDVISGGRAVLGLGAAWNEDEHRGYGFDFPEVPERLSRLEEALQIARLMFTEERPSFEGRYYRIDGALNNPRPIQAGGPPVLIGGSGERRTLRILARHGDIGNWFGPLPELLRLKGIFEEHCAAGGRDPGEVCLTLMAPVVLATNDADARRLLDPLPPERRHGVTAGSPERCAEALRPFVEAGFGGFVIRNPTLHDPEHFALATELIRLMDGLPPEVDVRARSAVPVTIPRSRSR